VHVLLSVLNQDTGDRESGTIEMGSVVVIREMTATIDLDDGYSVGGVFDWLSRMILVYTEDNPYT